MRIPWDWRVQETDVIQQAEGQAYWMYRGRSQQVQTAMVPIIIEQVRAGWQAIRRQEELQRQLLEGEAEHKAQARKQQDDAACTELEANTSKQQQNGTSHQSGESKSSKGAGTATRKKPTIGTSDHPLDRTLHHGNGKMPDPSPIPPQPDPDDDEPDRL